MNTDKNSIVGYCHNKDHKGCLTVTIMNEHDCVGKNCHYFEKFEDSPYWQKANRKEALKTLKKEKLNRQKENVKRHIDNVKHKEESIIEYALYIAEKQALCGFKPISVREDENGYILFYISNSNKNDWFEFRSIAFALSRRFNKKFTLKHAKNIDGEYEVL